METHAIAAFSCRPREAEPRHLSSGPAARRRLPVSEPEDGPAHLNRPGAHRPTGHIPPSPHGERLSQGPDPKPTGRAALTLPRPRRGVSLLGVGRARAPLRRLYGFRR